MTHVQSDCLDLSVDDLTNEILDMARPRDRHQGITWSEFEASGVGHVIIQILTDLNGFWEYENRMSSSCVEEAEEAEASTSYIHLNMTVNMTVNIFLNT